MEDYNGFKQKALEIGKAILELNNPVIVHHLDCDGITSGAMVALAFEQLKKPYRMKMLKRLDPESIKTVPDSDNYVFTDLGSGALDVINQFLPGKKVFIIDHHPPNGERKVEIINPHDFGFDGAIAACSASTAFWCFKHLQNPLHYEVGIVGAIGDMQDQEGMKFLNEQMLEEAIQKGIVSKKVDLKMFGKVSRALVSFLSFASEPFLPGLTGNDKNCAIFLDENEIPTESEGKKLKYYDLSEEDQKKLASALLAYATEKLGEEPARQLIGDTYTFLNEPADSELRDGYEFSVMMNACGRHDEPEAGIGVCLHNSPQALEKARGLIANHRMAISKGILLARESTMDLGAFYFFDGRGKVSDSVIGTVAGGFFASGAVTQSKPIISLSLDEEGQVKASSRANKALVQKGLHLGDVMRQSAEIAGGYGGGHNIAAGASFKPSKANVESFLKKAKEIIQTQLKDK